MKNELFVIPFGSEEPEIGRWLWALEDVRKTLLERLNGISQATLDAKIEGSTSIGSLLYHISIVEAGWLHYDILGTSLPPEIGMLFPIEPWSEDGVLTHVEGQSMDEHLHRLNTVRHVFLSHFKPMTLADWRAPRTNEEEGYDVTPEWVVYHLIEHEAQHRGQIFQQLRQLVNPQ
ncbi:DinB family protein [Alicyclobacillus ferrooxydans]|uniref:Damage-inducible protein DinB n=1 Tax=Alicyclobacillus ferrooxydans TaxID=471514 RepID=A0A0P9CYK2_9BACL|nr:DinB family protein [Alicyclobacillus ferrooxydans]KPV44833.1 damage-inducible protein DinB [Alicyclobacillus ferrooxydans]